MSERRSELDGGTVAASGLLTSGSSIVAAAHELKAPAALIRQLALTLHEADELGLSDAQKRDTLERIVFSAERSLRLSDTLTKAARLQDSLFELEPINMLQIAEDAAHELAPMYRQYGRELRVSSRPGTPLAVANRELARLVAVNLCDNALKHTSDSKPVLLSVAAGQKPSTIRMNVRDHGPSTKSGSLPNVNRILGGSPMPLSGRPESSGLGLFVAGQFARAMEGDLGFIRHKDGASFYLDLPTSRQLELFGV